MAQMRFLRNLICPLILLLLRVDAKRMAVTEHTNADDSAEGYGLCDPDIVNGICADLNQHTEEYWNDANGRNQMVLHAAELAEYLATPRDNIITFLKAIRVGNMGSGNSFAFTCMDLCAATLQSIPAHERPSKSGVGCYYLEDGKHCDVDLSDDALQALAEGVKDSPPDFSREIESSSFRRMPTHMKPTPNGYALMEEHEVEALKSNSSLDADPFALTIENPLTDKMWTHKQLKTAILNTFSIYPIMESAIQDPEGGGEGMDESAVPPPEGVRFCGSADADTGVKDLIGNCRQLFEEYNLQCNHKMMQESCRAYCGLESSKPKAPCTPYNGGCIDKESTGMMSGGRDLQCFELTTSCHMETVRRNCPATCGLVCPSRAAALPVGSPAAELMKVAVLSQGYVARAFSRLASRDADPMVERWFGRNDENMRRQVRKQLLGASLVLTHAYFKYPGVQCEGRTIAYVSADPPYDKNSRGLFNVHVCEYYSQVSDATKIQTLTHESFHHHWMRRHDMCTKGDGSWGPECPGAANKAYGMGACRKFAEFPDAAVENADSFAYFILSVNDPYTGGCVDQNIDHLGLSINGRYISCYEADNFCEGSDDLNQKFRKACGETCKQTCKQTPVNHTPNPQTGKPTRVTVNPGGQRPQTGTPTRVTRPTVKQPTRPKPTRVCADKPNAGYASTDQATGVTQYPSCADVAARCKDEGVIESIIKANCPKTCGLC